LCAVCAEGHFPQLGMCKLCEHPRVGAIVLVVVVLACLVGSCRWLWSRYSRIFAAMSIGAHLKIAIR
jgi:hypothetical protein